MDKKEENLQNIITIGCQKIISDKYLYDIKMLHMNPVVFYEPNVEPVKFPFSYQIERFNFTENDYQKTLAKIRSYHPVLVLAGAEKFVELVTRIQNDLHLVSNDKKYINMQTRKEAMHEALKKAGIRYIRGEVAHNEKEAIKIYRKLKVKEVITKPIISWSSQGLSLCHNENELKKRAHLFFNDGVKIAGKINKSELLIQERIKGTEYFVNTISRFGKHRVMEIWKYHLVATRCGELAFESIYSVNKLDNKMNQLINYCKDVLNALHVVNGPAHTEFYIDEKGPVMIEINCRIAGGGFSTEYLNDIFGHHDTDLVLNALLFPNNLSKTLNEPYLGFKHGIIKFIVSPRSFKVKSYPILKIVKRFKSFESTISIPFESRDLDETVSFTTMGGYVRFLHQDENLAKRDYQILSDIEKKYFHLLFEDVDHNKEDLPKRIAKGETLDILFPDIVSRGLTLILNDKKINNVPYATVTDLKNVGKELDGYAYGVINLKKNYDHLLREDYIEGILTMMDKIRTGGTIYISERSANLFPYGFKGYEMLLKVAGFKDIKKKNSYLIATKIR